MARITSKSLLLGIAVSLVLMFLAVVALLPWIGVLDQRDQSHRNDSHKSTSQEDDTSEAVTLAESQPSHSHEHEGHSREDEVQMGSPIASANYIDQGYLQRNNRGQRDRTILVCDFSSNGKKAQAISNGPPGSGRYLSTYDVDGAGGSCWSRTGGFNGYLHFTKNWRYGGFGSWGPTSYHYR